MHGAHEYAVVYAVVLARDLSPLETFRNQQSLRIEDAASFPPKRR
jgi:hypothetical protein